MFVSPGHASPSVRRMLWLVPVLLGIASFLLVFGPQILIPTNIGWLQSGDRAQHFLGWQFFRHGPWQFPIGLNPNFGMELSSAIIYSDSNPVMALLFKALDHFLPEPFQYFGLWILLCFILQAIFAWKIAALFTKSPWVCTLITVIAIFSPPFLFRLPYHMSLGAHFIVLTALFLAIRPVHQYRAWPWALLLSVAVGLHAYLLVLAGAIWAGQMLDLLRSRQITLRQSLLEMMTVFACVLISMYLVGYFSTQSVSGTGFGFFRMNLLSYFNPFVNVMELNWSYLLRGPSFDSLRDNFEGFNYAGLGVLFLIPLAIFASFRLCGRIRHWLNKHLFLSLVLVILALFALSHEIGFGNLTYRINLPETLLNAANTFRASGRMFWPAFYALLFLIVLCIAKGYRQSIACVLLGIAAVTQVLDTSAGWKYFKREGIHEISITWETPLKNPIWAEFMSHYTHIRMSPPANPDDWKEMAYLAGKFHRATDSVLLARVDESKLATSKMARMDEFIKGEYAKDSLYVLDEPSLMTALPRINQTTDLLALIDGYFIVAPGWLSCATCKPYTGPDIANLFTAINNEPAPLEFGKRRFGFSSSDNNLRYLVTGWSTAEPWGVWSSSPKARVTIPVAPSIKFVSLTVHPFINIKKPRQKFFLTLNDQPSGEFELGEGASFVLRLPITDEIRARIRDNSSLNVDFYMPEAVSPSILGTGMDDRMLGIGLHAIEVYE